MESNKQYAEQIVGQLCVMNPPSFLMDIAVFDSTTQSRMNLLGEALFEDTNKTHFELLHLNNRILFTQNCISHNGMNTYTIDVMYGTLILADSVMRQCEQTRSKLQCELNRM